MRIDKNGKEIEKNIFYTYYLFIYLLIVQDLWNAHCHILLIIFLKEFIELKVNSDDMTKNVEHAELNITIATIFLNRKILKMI